MSCPTVWNPIFTFIAIAVVAKELSNYTRYLFELLHAAELGLPAPHMKGI